MKLNLCDIEFQAFSGSGPGGQKRNKCQNCIRAIHKPTGISAVSTTHKSQTKNKQAAIENLQTKIDKLTKEEKDAADKKAYQDKSEASFGSQIRTYRLVGNAQGITDHRTGITTNLNPLLKGELDALIGFPVD